MAKPYSTLFVAPTLLPPCSSGNSAVSNACPRTRPSRLTINSKQGGADDGSKGSRANDGPDNFDEGALSFGRFREFTQQEGDIGTQDDLVREVLWQATRLSTSESMETTIQSHLDAASEVLSEMYSKSERDIEERNQRLAIETSLPDISKWNKHLINGSKASKQHRQEISKELAIVDALLKRAERSQRPSGMRRRRRRRRSVAVVDPVQSSTTLAAAVSTSRGLAFTSIVCVVAMESFDAIASQEGGPSRLVNLSAVSALLVVAAAYTGALRSALERAQSELDRRA